MTYIATFFSHFGAIRFADLLKEQNIIARLQPVPRNLSSSCGTSVQYEMAEPFPTGMVKDEIEQIFLVKKDNYEAIYRAEGL